MLIGWGWKQCMRRLARDSGGQVAVIFGFCAIPIITAVSIGLDMANSSHMKSELQAAADSAVLAAARRLSVGADDSDKEGLALETFYAISRRACNISS